nr:hypothetical protein [Candidatus Sigynarchaeum springense]MDO8118726.1 hypothetical protein [Candidatus Sigynarchaeota archaeon]
MQLDPIPVTLFCGMGGHARSIFIYMKRYAVRKMYVVYSKYNTPEYEAIIDIIKNNITEEIKLSDHVIEIRYLQINEQDLLPSIEAVARLHDQERSNSIITDITAGHKIISFILWSVHMMSSHKFDYPSRMVYFFRDDDTPVELPTISTKRLQEKEETCLKCIHQGMRPPFPPASIHRYKALLKTMGFIDQLGHVTPSGLVYLLTM